MVYALASFLFLSGIIRKNLLLLRITLLVAFLYGGMVWLMLPIKEHVSWEGHLAGALSGAVLAFYYRNMGPKDPIYKYELSEATGEDLPEWWMRGNPNHPDTIAQRAEKEEEKSPSIDEQSDSTSNVEFTYQWTAKVNEKTNTPTRTKTRTKSKSKTQNPEK